MEKSLKMSLLGIATTLTGLAIVAVAYHLTYFITPGNMLGTILPWMGSIVFLAGGSLLLFSIVVAIKEVFGGAANNN